MIKYLKRKIDAYILRTVNQESEELQLKSINWVKPKTITKKINKRELVGAFYGQGKAKTVSGRAMDSALSGSSEAQAKQTQQEFYEYLLNFKDETPAILSIYAKDPIVHRALSFQASDAVRNGFVINGLEEEQVKKIDSQFNIHESLVKSVFLSLIHGGSVISFEEKNENADVSLPINSQTFSRGRYNGFYVSNAEDVTSEMTGTRKNVERWFLFGEEYHSTRVVPLVIDGEYESPSYTDKWEGKSLAQSMITNCFQHTQAKQILLAAMKAKSLLSVSIDNEDFWTSIAANSDENSAHVSSIAEYIKDIRDSGGVIVTPAGSKIASSTLTASDLVEACVVFMKEIAASAKMPITKLFGDLVSGLNASGEGSRKVYNERLSDIQQKLNGIIVKHYEYASGVSGLSVSWNPLDEPTEAEKWEANQKKSKIIVDLRGSGVISADESREWLKDDKGLGFGEIEERSVDLDSEQEPIDE